MQLIDSSKVFVLDLRAQVGTRFRTRDADLKTKNQICDSDLKPLGPCNSKPLKQSKSSRSQMFFEIGCFKNFAIFTGKHLCWGLFLIKLQAFRLATFSKRDSNTVVFCGYFEIFKNSFFIENLWWLLLTVLPQYNKVS